MSSTHSTQSPVSISDTEDSNQRFGKPVYPPTTSELLDCLLDAQRLHETRIRQDNCDTESVQSSQHSQRSQTVDSFDTTQHVNNLVSHHLSHIHYHINNRYTRGNLNFYNQQTPTHVVRHVAGLLQHILNRSGYIHATIGLTYTPSRVIATWNLHE
jgi:hypothetical protein